MHLKHFALLLCTMLLTMTACTPFSLMKPSRVEVEAPLSGEIEGGQARTQRDIAVFYTEHEPGYRDSMVVLTEKHEHMSSVIGFWYQVDPETFRLLSVSSPEDIARSTAAAKARGLNTEMLVYNFLYGSTAASTQVLTRLMTDPAAQKAFIDDLTETALRLGYDGVSIDFEHLRPEYRDAFSELVEAIADAVHEAGLSLSISVGAKTWDDPNNGWAGGYDYARLGRAVDRLIVMTYDEHGFSSGPGPIASSGWVERVVHYVTSQVPPEKVMLGIAGYGFDWNHAGGSPRYLSYEQAERLRRSVGAALQWDAESNTPYFTYYDQAGNFHEVWFESAASTTWKLDLIDEYNLGGMALWRLGLEDPGLWDVIGQKFIPVR